MKLKILVVLKVHTHTMVSKRFHNFKEAVDYKKSTCMLIIKTL